jgi:hypothetical protein
LKGFIVSNNIIEEVPGFYRILKLNPFRKTEGVSFEQFPMPCIDRVDAMDRVLHLKEAVSPGPIGNVERPWYMHPHQSDNLIVLMGVRFVDIYSIKHGVVEQFEVTPDTIKKNGKIVAQGGAVLVWPQLVFHRIRSGENGSASLNIAQHYEGFDIKKNFNIYDLNTEKGTFTILRHGYEDQF